MNSYHEVPDQTRRRSLWTSSEYTSISNPSFSGLLWNTVSSRVTRMPPQRRIVRTKSPSWTSTTTTQRKHYSHYRRINEAKSRVNLQLTRQQQVFLLATGTTLM